jgi:hypothetical protein
MKVKTMNGEVLDLQCQQYTLGLYVCLYEKGRMHSQYVFDTTQEKFIKDIKDGNTNFKLVK